MKRHKPARDEAKELADQARLLRAWRTWHQEQLADALNGAHGAAIAKLMTVLDQLELNSAEALLDFMQRTEWGAVSADVRLTILHQINAAITKLRERNGMAPIDDPLPGARDNAYRRVKDLLFPPSPAKANSSPSEVATAERTGRNETAAQQSNESK